MIRKIGLLTVLGVLLIGLIPVRAQDEIKAQNTTPLNVRSGPGQNYDIISALQPFTTVILEGRSEDSEWVLAHTLSGLTRGWMAAHLLAFPANFSPESLLVSDEILAPTDSAGDQAGDPSNEADRIRTRAEVIDLTAYPILSESLGQAQTIFERGQELGRDAHVVAKVGDCNTAGWVFLYPFGEDQYDLGPYGDLQGVVDTFQESFTHRAYAAHNGLNAGAVLDPMWATPGTCEANESPLDCEYRTYNPAIAVIMFGTNDMVTLTAEQFDFYLRQVVDKTIDAGIIPVLSTFPRHLSFPDRSILFNQIVVRIALDYDLPLINLWLALEPLPNHGIAEDGFHLDGPLTRAGDFSSLPNLETGVPLRNLLTLQMLDRIWREVMQ